MTDNKEKKKEISEIIRNKLASLNVSEEDISLIDNLVSSYYRKRKGISHSAPETMAAALLWAYSKSNFLWEGNAKWSRQGLAELFNANPKTVGDVASKIMKSLNIGYWDGRFCRQDVMKDNPFDKYVMNESGFIVSKEMLEVPLKHVSKNKTKEDYLDEAMEYLEKDDKKSAIECLHKALALDNNYLEAISDLGLIYFYTDIKKSKEYYEKACELSKKELGGEWPKELEWGTLKNRPYLLSLQGLGLICWRENEIEEAKKLFELLLTLNPNDNQGIRYCMTAIYMGLAWDKLGKIEERCANKGEYDELDNLLNEQNKIHNFWKAPEEDE